MFHLFFTAFTSTFLQRFIRWLPSWARSIRLRICYSQGSRFFQQKEPEKSTKSTWLKRLHRRSKTERSGVGSALTICRTPRICQITLIVSVRTTYDKRRLYAKGIRAVDSHRNCQSSMVAILALRSRERQRVRQVSTLPQVLA